MKIKLGDLRRVVREEGTKELTKEEFLRGIPEFVLRRATQKYVDDIRQQLKRYVLMNKSETGVDRKNAIAAAESVLEDLEEKANDLLEDALFTFVRQI